MSKINDVHSFRGFITFEGIEGSGKSTQVRLLADYLREKGSTVLTTEEPGGTKIGLKIRAILLSPENEMDSMTELLLYCSSRAQHVREVIYPALIKRTIVLCDRFTDSTLAYQGSARGIDLSVIKTLDDIVATDLKPSVTFLLDVNVEDGLRRNRRIRKRDRFEIETIEFHNRVREGFLQIAREEPERVKVIDASRSIEEVNREIIGSLETLWR